MDSRVMITNIQRFSLHDGPGIRTTVFCKGCSLHCPWCSNPENIQYTIEEHTKDDGKGTYGRLVSCDELYDELIKDKIFYAQFGVGAGLKGMPGGVTFSGGEPLLQFDRLEPLLQRLRNEKIHICTETALFVPKEQLRIAIEYVDLFYIDIKILDADTCHKTLGGQITQYLTNIGRVFSAQKPVVFRVPVIGGYTDDEMNRDLIIKLLNWYRPKKVELIKEHNLGREKYLTLGMEPLNLNRVTDEVLEQYREEIIAKTGVETEVCRV